MSRRYLMCFGVTARDSNLLGQMDYADHPSRLNRPSWFLALHICYASRESRSRSIGRRIRV